MPISTPMPGPRTASATPDPGWATIYDECHNAMHAAAARSIRGADHPEFDTGDVVNEAFAEVMSDPPEGVRSWHALLVDLTARRARECLEGSVTRSSLAGVDDGLVDPDDVAEIATRHVHAEATRRRMLRVMDYMTPRQREITRLRLFEGRSVGEIAVEMNTSSSNISQIVVRCLTKLLPVLTQLDEIESGDVERVRPPRRVS